MKIFRLSELADCQEEFTMGFEVFSGMEMPALGDEVMAVLGEQRIVLQIISEPEFVVNQTALVCIFRVKRA